MDEREDYAEPDTRGLGQPRRLTPRYWAIGIVSFVLLATVLICFLVLAPQSEQHQDVRESIRRAGVLMKACKVYLLKSDGSYPTKLADIVKYLDQPDLTDAWGNPFRYALVPNKDGVMEPYIWAERVQEGKVTLHGVKLSADGKQIVFGRPDD